MTEVARNATQEYWKPVQTQRTEVRGMEAETLCANCGSEYAVGARFCHVCGNEREPDVKISRQTRIAQMVNFDQLCEKVGLSAAALVLAVIGAVCVLGAILVGLIYTANTVLDWQAVQVWRIQWMLGALVAFAAAILFNRKKTA